MRSHLRKKAQEQPEFQEWLTLDFFESEVRASLLQMNIPEALVTPARLEKLFLFSKEIELWNRQINLVGKFDKEFVVLHLLDSLSALPELLKMAPKRGADVGSGAGLPGVVLAIFMDTTHWTLIERSGKRAGFLRNVILRLGLSKVITVLEKSVEEVKEEYDLIVFRAFRAFATFFPVLKDRLSPCGCLVAYKGKIENIESEIESQSSIEQENHFQVIRVNIPSLEQERHLLLYRLSQN